MARRHVSAQERRYGWGIGIGRHSWRDHYFLQRNSKALCGTIWCRTTVSLFHKSMYACKTCERLHKKRAEARRAGR